VTRRRRPAAIALAAVFIVKLAVVLQLRDHILLQADAGLDTSVYLELAQRVVAGNLSLGPGLYFVSPLYIYFCAAILAAVPSLTAIRIAQIALGTASVAFVFVATREWFGRTAAWCAAALAASTGLFTFYEVLVLQAALDPFLTSASLAALALGLNGRGRRWMVIAGVTFGCACLNRPNTVIAVAAVGIVLLLVRRWRDAALVGMGVLVALAPAGIRNAAVTGEWSLVSSHGGLNFYIGNNSTADGTYHGVPGITPNIAGQQEDARRVAEAALGRKLGDAEVSAYFYGLGWSWIRAHPGAAAALFVRKLQYTLSARHLWLNYSYPFFAYDERTLLALLVAGPWILVPIGLTGLVARAPRGRLRSYAVWLAFVPAYAISVAVFFASERYRLPLLTPSCIGGGALLSYIFELLHTRNVAPVAVPSITAAALATVVNWPLPLDDGRYEERVRMSERLIAAERYTEAEPWISRAMAGNSAPGPAEFRIGRALLARGRADAALPHLQAAARIDPGQSETSFALGQALLDAQRPGDAVPHLRKALDAGVRPDITGYDLARALASTGDRADALHVLRNVRPARADDGTSWYALGELAEELSEPALAASFYSEAADAAPQQADPRERFGVMLAMTGDIKGAVRQLERAVAVDPRDASARLNLAVAYSRAGRFSDARSQASEALRLDPSYEKAKNLLSAIPK